MELVRLLRESRSCQIFECVRYWGHFSTYNFIEDALHRKNDVLLDVKDFELT